eukprot:1404244-Amphidinium_carterae.1
MADHFRKRPTSEIGQLWMASDKARKYAVKCLFSYYAATPEARRRLSWQALLINHKSEIRTYSKASSSSAHVLFNKNDICAGKFLP